MYPILKQFNPEMFQGRFKRKNYFEGWYFKLVDELGKNVWAIIPGVSYGHSEQDVHAFIQVIDAQNYKTSYFKYDISMFKYSGTDFDISIADNTFNRNRICLNLNNEDFQIQGELDFYDIVPFPKTIFNPGIMGPYSFIPFMECYHGIINIHHQINGSILINNQQVSFSNGYGYIEKDWGKSFPESWVWLQSNHFVQKNVSVMFSIAKIPWLNKHFIGFVSFLRINEKLYRFATYSGAKIQHFECKNQYFKVVVGDKRYTMTISGDYAQSGVLKAPKMGGMSREINESISSTIFVALVDKKGELIFNGQGKKVGMEIVGETLYK